MFRIDISSNADTPPDSAPVATFEGTAGDNSNEYLNVDPNNIVSNVAANVTSGGTKVLRMNQSYKIGPSKSIRVFPGDMIDLEVWEYHEGTAGFGTTTTPLTTLISLVSGTFGGVSGGAGDPGLIYNGVNEAINTFLPGGNLGSTRPAAYLNYILFDKNYKVLDMGWVPAPANTFTKQKLSFPTKNIKEEGYMFVYLSYDNDSNNWVYFDGLKATHTRTNVIQYNEYYPFGLQTANSWTREDATENRYRYNGGAELNATTGWYETYFRGYDATLGRFLQADPLAHQSSSFTPYNYAFNNPVMFNDPMGDYPRAVQIEMERIARSGGGYNGPATYDPRAGFRGPGSGYHWSDGYRGIDDNAVLMPRNTFENYYGISDEQDRFDLAAKVGTTMYSEGSGWDFSIGSWYLVTWSGGAYLSVDMTESLAHARFSGSMAIAQQGKIDLGASDRTGLFNDVMRGLYEGHRDGKTMLDVFDFKNASRNFTTGNPEIHTSTFVVGGTSVIVTLIKPGFPDGKHTPLPIVLKQPENIHGTGHPSQWPGTMAGVKVEYPFIYKFYDYEKGAVAVFSFHRSNAQAYSNFISYMNTGKSDYLFK